MKFSKIRQNRGRKSGFCLFFTEKPFRYRQNGSIILKTFKLHDNVTFCKIEIVGQMLLQVSDENIDKLYWVKGVGKLGDSIKVPYFTRTNSKSCRYTYISHKVCVCHENNIYADIFLSLTLLRHILCPDN